MEIIKFNKKIYSAKAIEQAVKEYKDFANFSIEVKDDYLEVAIDSLAKEQKNLKNEFANFVLGLMS